MDVNCHIVPPAVRDAAGLLVFTTSSGTFRCTGTLLADLDPNTHAGYLLTANHCFDTPAAAASLTVYWFYQTAACEGTVPPLADLPRSHGNTLLATSTNTDFTLVRLADDPQAGQGFAQWTTNAPVGPLVSIHQPAAAARGIGPLNALSIRRHGLHVFIAGRPTAEFMDGAATAGVNRMLLPVAVAAHDDDVGGAFVP